MGCNKDNEVETESEPAVVITEQITEAETETEKKVTVVSTKYISKDKTLSIHLPDETWENKRDIVGTLEFEAEEKGSIIINHIANVDTSKAKLPSSKADVLNNLQENGKDIEYYEVLEFTKQEKSAQDEYFTLVKCTDALEKYFYTVSYDIVKGNDIYTVSGYVEQDDEELLKQIQDSVESFQVISKPNTVDGETETETTKDDGTIVDSMVIYDANGNPIYINKDANGVWKDSSGKTYDVQQYGAMGSDGYWYTFYQPETSSTEAAAPETNGFYDNNGNYVNVTKDANGNWVDRNGVIYYFGDTGVTDSNGGYYPYRSESSTTGFYDSNGNYIMVSKDGSGNWVDSAGTVYYFGDTGVTDASGNFYPY